MDFEDFAFWRLDVDDVYFVCGFAAMGWVEAADYGAPLAKVAEGTTPTRCSRTRASSPTSPLMRRAWSVDRLGFKLHLRQAERRWSVRSVFPREVTTAAGSRTVLIEMARQARA